MTMCQRYKIIEECKLKKIKVQFIILKIDIKLNMMDSDRGIRL